MAMHDQHPPIPAELMGDAPFTDDQLDDYLDQQNVGGYVAIVESHPDSAPGRVHGWQVDDDRAAEWAMRKLAERRRQIDEVRAQAEAYKAEIDDWVDRVTAGPERSARYFEGKLVDYQHRRLDANPKAGRLDLPSGQVRSTDNTRNATVKITDPRVFAMWAYDNLPAPVRVAVMPPQPPKVLPSKLDSDLVRAVKVGDTWRVVHVDGEEVPGAKAEPGSLTIKVVPS